LRPEKLDLDFCRVILPAVKTSPRALTAAFLGRWMLEAAIAGGIAAVVVEISKRIILAALGSEELAAIHPLLVSAAAAMLVGGMIYRIAPGAAGEGIPSYLEALRNQGRRLSIRATLFKYPAAIITLAGYGSGGAVGFHAQIESLNLCQEAECRSFCV
jgi:H+/Cl- antiporter ClcA